jgi:hypothetical protein
VKDLDRKFEQTSGRSIPPSAKLAEEISGHPENYYSCPCSAAFVAIGPRVRPRVAGRLPTITTGYAYPWEDLKVKE